MQSNFPVLSLLDIREFYVDHTEWIFSRQVSAIQFTVEKSEFNCEISNPTTDESVL